MLAISCEMILFARTAFLLTVMSRSDFADVGIAVEMVWMSVLERVDYEMCACRLLCPWCTSLP